MADVAHWVSFACNLAPFSYTQSPWLLLSLAIDLGGESLIFHFCARLQANETQCATSATSERAPLNSANAADLILLHKY